MSKEKTYRIIKGDEINSILSAALRELTTEQLVILRDSLIARTSPIEDEKALQILSEELNK